VTRKICVVTGSRADYGLLNWLMKEIQADARLQLQVMATGMHLSPEFGLTFKDIEADGFRIDEKVEMLLSSDTPIGIAKSIGLGTISMADSLARLQPDIVVLLGDRFETFAAAQAALVARIPIAHLHGGETTEGAIDEAFRHAITKMSHLHFTSAEAYRERVIQLGEDPQRVFSFGAAAMDNLNRIKLLDRVALEVALDFRLGKRNLLVTFHPVTLENASASQQFSALLQALEGLDDCNFIFTKPNADTDGRIIGDMIDAFAGRNSTTAAAFTSLGQLRYLSTMRLVDGVVGNSSSGLIEAPSFGIGTVNIGDRQKGRIRADSVIDCAPETKAIQAALERLFSDGFRQSLAVVVNPYGSGPVAQRIAHVLAATPLDGMLKKAFYSLSNTSGAEHAH
jgi:GDP/UDP-N,N'-diacetylbacillosamine 2-epimerase (hydrolysing)